MRYLRGFFYSFLFTNISFNVYANTYEQILLDIKRNIEDKEHAVKVGQHLKYNKEMTLPVKESLRQGVIINSKKRDFIIDYMENAGLINKTERLEILNQVNTYNEIVKKMKDDVKDIDIEMSYSGYRCTKIESKIYDPNVIVPFKRNLKISDVSAHQDFFKFYSNRNILITHVPNIENVIDHISYKEGVKFTDLEKKLIYNNGTAVSMYSKVNMKDKTYYMFPYKIFTYETNDLAELTTLEYAYFGLNLKLAGLLTPEIYQTHKKIFRRNASLCLYSKN